MKLYCPIWCWVPCLPGVSGVRRLAVVGEDARPAATERARQFSHERLELLVGSVLTGPMSCLFDAILRIHFGRLRRHANAWTMSDNYVGHVYGVFGPFTQGVTPFAFKNSLTASCEAPVSRM